MSRPRRAQRAAPLPSTDLEQLRQRVRALAENRPAIYRMTDALGRVIYVGKAKRLRTRLLTYFRAEYPDDKAARILYAASDIAWDYVPSEFAAYLGELRQIRKFRPHFNHRGNVTRRSVLIKISDDIAPQGVCRGDRRQDRRALLRPVPVVGSHPRGRAHAQRPPRASRLHARDARRVRRPARPVRHAAPGRVHAPRVRFLQPDRVPGS